MKYCKQPGKLAITKQHVAISNIIRRIVCVLAFCCSLLLVRGKLQLLCKQVGKSLGSSPYSFSYTDREPLPSQRFTLSYVFSLVV